MIQMANSFIARNSKCNKNEISNNSEIIITTLPWKMSKRKIYQLEDLKVFNQNELYMNLK
jgi:hypothetical protein